MSDTKHFIRFKAQEGPQSALFECPAEDILYGGARGGGKSYGVLGHFDRHQQQFGDIARGIFFRRTYPELEDIISKAKDIFLQEKDPMRAEWLDTKKTLKFPNNATLKFRFLEKDKDADRYQGHEYSWICIEEAGNFPSPVPINKLRACLRSAAGARKTFLLTANPGGPGHNWLKASYIDPAPAETIHSIKNEIEMEGVTSEVSWDRVFIPAKVTDNKILMDNDPNYIANIVASAGGAEWLIEAWLKGSWDITAGGMFDDIWDRSKHILRSDFTVPISWKVYRSFDWGSSKPFSVGWWAVSDGSPIIVGGVLKHFYPGTLVRIAEWYGWSGTPNTGLRLLEKDIIKGIHEKDSLVKKKYGIKRIFGGPADSAIFTVQDGESIAQKHEKRGVYWDKADKSPGSRIHAWQEMRQLMSNSKKFPMEDRGLFVTDECLQFIRTVPTIQRDQKNLDDINTAGEDHICDESGYMCRWRSNSIRKVAISGF